MSRDRVDFRAVGVFCVAAYGLSWGAAALLVWRGGAFEEERTHWLLLALTIIPALTAVVVSVLTKDSRYPLWRLSDVPARAALTMVVLVPAVFVCIYGLTALLPGSEMSLEGARLARDLVQDHDLAPDDVPSGPVLVALLWALSIVAGPTLLALAAIPHELAWRAYLLPKLGGMGRGRAALLTGLLNGMWFAPLLFADAAGLAKPWLAASLFLGVCIAFGTVLAELWFRFQHLGLSAVAMGAFLGQVMGVYSHIVRDAAWPWGGSFGVIAIAAWLVLAGVLRRSRLASDEAGEAGEQAAPTPPEEG